MVKLFTFGEVDERRCGKAWWEPETKCYDEARGSMRVYMVEHGEHDPEDCKYYDCPDEVVEDYCNEHLIMFDEHGEPWAML